MEFALSFSWLIRKVDPGKFIKGWADKVVSKTMKPCRFTTPFQAFTSFPVNSLSQNGLNVNRAGLKIGLYSFPLVALGCVLISQDKPWRNVCLTINIAAVKANQKNPGPNRLSVMLIITRTIPKMSASMLSGIIFIGAGVTSLFG